MSSLSDVVSTVPMTTAFYKGTSVPPMCPELMKGIFTTCIPEQVAKCHTGSKADKIKACKASLDYLEKLVCDYHAAHPEAAGTLGEVKNTLIDYWGPDPELATMRWVHWYACVGALLQLGGIENDEKNGWLVIRELA